jgi:SAM-dependent MidA family methyltransferase
MQLSDIIIKKITDEGPISFRDFMEMALYYPEKGYYTSSTDRIGTTGDFYTSSSLTPAFGAAIARQIEEMWDILGRKEFTIVEYGAGTGTLCHDILTYLKTNHEFYNRLNYCIIEKSPAMREKEKSHLHEKVSWYDSIKDIPSIKGCILSNELPDNFAVHQVVVADELMEVYVGYENGFIEMLKPAPKVLKDYLAELEVVLPNGFRTEINLEAIEWIREMATSLKKGCIITIDYGFLSEEMYSERHSRGTLISYNKHRVLDNIYLNPGEQDITSHVNFSALHHWGVKYGLESYGIVNLADFLLSLGFKDYLHKTLSQEKGQDLINLVKRESFITRTLLIDMGYKYKVLIQGKGIAPTRLTGLKLLQKNNRSVPIFN